VRAGIAWSNVGYRSYSRRGIAPECLRLLTEIMAMDSSGPSAYYGGASHAIYLESIASRRIWDLLAEARDLGLPLVHAGKQAPPVTVCDDTADLVLDLSRSATGLALRSQVTVGRERPALEAALLLGDPVHGIAWWQADGEPEPRPNSGLRLARFSQPVDPALRHLFEQGTLLVPRRDETRFFSQYYAALRQRVRVASGDESVTLPEPRPPALSLIVEHLADHRLSLDGSGNTASRACPGGNRSVRRTDLPEGAISSRRALSSRP